MDMAHKTKRVWTYPGSWKYLFFVLSCFGAGFRLWITPSPSFGNFDTGDAIAGANRQREAKAVAY